MTAKRKRMPYRDEKLRALEERQSLRNLSENHSIPRHVLLSDTAIDDDPDLAYYEDDLYR